MFMGRSNEEVQEALHLHDALKGTKILQRVLLEAERERLDETIDVSVKRRDEVDAELEVFK